MLRCCLKNGGIQNLLGGARRNWRMGITYGCQAARQAMHMLCSWLGGPGVFQTVPG